MSDGTEVERPRVGGPARGYSWRTAWPGNDLALEHGAHSPRRVQPIADELHAQLVAEAPWTASTAFAGTVRSWAWAEGQAVLLRRWIDEHGLLDDEGEERSAARLLDRVEGRLSKLRDQLGLNPQALGRLLATAADVAHATGDTETLASLQAEGRKILDTREVTTDDDDEETTDAEGH